MVHGDALTYGMLADTLPGLNNFRLFYPHLDFDFEIFLPQQEDIEIQTGIGALFNYIP